MQFHLHQIMQLDLVRIHMFNDILSTAIGSLANLLVLYLVRKRTAKELRQYSKTLVQNCFIDLLFNIAIFITKVQVDAYDGLMIFMLGGFAANVPHPWDHLFHMTYVYFVYFTIIAMVVPFYCRYRVFCKADMLSNYRIGVLYFYAALAAFCHNFIFAFSVIPTAETFDKTSKVLNNSIFLRPNGKLPYFVLCDTASPICLGMLGSCTFVFVFCYACIIFFGIKINKKLSENGDKWNPKTRTFHWEINQALAGQAIIPFLSSVIPITTVICLTIFKINIHGIVLIASITISWACVLNPFIVMFTVTIYRKAIMHPMRYLFNNKNVITPQNSFLGSAWRDYIVPKPRVNLKSTFYESKN